MLICPPAFDAYVGVTPFEFCRALPHQKARVPGLSCAVLCLIIHLAVLVEHRLVTDRQTHDYGVYRASMASRCKNEVLSNGQL